ncbi:MAG: alpha/beta hydrolase [Eubacteriales bacterium]
MLNQIYPLLEGSAASLTTYVLEKDPYDHRGIKHPAIIVCPGGGYQYVSRNEGEPVALAFTRAGYCAFVLDYSVRIENPFPQSLKELSMAIKLVRSHAEEWNIDPDDITVAGFSAGGHLALSMGVFYNKKFLTDALDVSSEEIRPNALVLGYPAVTLIPWRRGPIDPEIVRMMDEGLLPDLRGADITQILSGKMDVTEEEKAYFNLLNHISENTPPSFIWGSNQDSVIHPSDLWGLATHLRESGVPYELHIFGRGPHGQGTSDENVLPKSALSSFHLKEWVRLALLWLEENRNEKHE